MSTFSNEIILDDFETIDHWTLETTEGVDAELALGEGETGTAMRLDFDFHDGSGFVIARRKLAIPLDNNYLFSFKARGEAPNNNFEFKLINPFHKNVWWVNRRDFEFPDAWQRIDFKKRHFSFAWGPARGGEPHDIGAIEFAISAGKGGKGSIWIDNLSYEPREVLFPYGLLPEVKASTTAEGYAATALFDQQTTTGWRSGSVSDEQWLQLDFHKRRELGGLVIDWHADHFARTYEVEISDDAENWQPVYNVKSGNGGRDYVYLPDTETRYLRLNLKQSNLTKGYGISTLEIKPYAFSSTPNAFFSSIAQDSIPGSFPRYFSGKQSYWTVAGVPSDTKEALINEEGLVEIDKGGFTIEPLVFTDGQLITWHDVQRNQTLEDGYLPIPTVHGETTDLSMSVTALASGKPGQSSLYLKYHVVNRTARHQQGHLYLAVRPFQVTPPWQNLNMEGGISRIDKLDYADDRLIVNTQKTIQSLTSPDRFGATQFEQGNIIDFLRTGHLPKETHITDPSGFASAALDYEFDLDPGANQSFYLLIPFHNTPQEKENFPAGLSAEAADELWQQRFEETRQQWQTLLDHVLIDLPPAEQKLVKTLKSNLAYILINQNDAAIQPGTRNYDRSWIRDGALTSSALLGMGYTEPVRRFIRWYATHQFPSGKVPCCIDDRGADPTSENDSHGQWIYLIMEYYRYTHDIGFLTEMWPSVINTMGYIDSLRLQRMTEAFTQSAEKLFYGLVPKSISHEGYSSNPVHAYWDGFFTLRGLKDATDMARILGEPDQAKAYAETTQAFRHDLYTSIKRSIVLNNIDYIPGAAELGDFDATSTTVAIDPVGELPNLPMPALQRTFERFYKIFKSRKHGELPWKTFTPYEVRTIGTFIRMNDPVRAHELLEYYLQQQRPAGWNQWPEVIRHNRDEPGFIGDIPHTWVGSDFIRSVRSLFAYERESDQSLVIGAGIKAEWLDRPEGVSIKRLPTYHGTLNYTMQKNKDSGNVNLTLSGDLVPPRGGVIVHSPYSQPLTGVTINGINSHQYTADSAVINQLPAEIVLHYEPSLAQHSGDVPSQ